MVNNKQSADSMNEHLIKASQEINKLVYPMYKNPASYAKYEEILYSKETEAKMEANGVMWTVKFMHAINAIHTKYDNPNLHKHR